MATAAKKNSVKPLARQDENGIPPKRLEVLKTYKIYIGGKFPRTESGRYYKAINKDGGVLANLCLSSRKDFRDAVIASRTAFGDWSTRAAFNRGQVLYRIAEMLESRKAQFIHELILQDIPASAAETEVLLSIDRLIYYAGWCDKFQQIFSTVNPVASSHFNFSVPEPTGVVSIIAPEENSLLGLVSAMSAAIAGGNTCIILASYSKPLCAVSLAEVLNSSDVPGGVVNVLTGKASDLIPYFADHMDVNAIVICDRGADVTRLVQEKAAINLKRVTIYDQINWLSDDGQSPYFIMDLQEVKTTWHPIENIGGSAPGY